MKTHVVYWFETNSFTGKTTRHWIDCRNERDAINTLGYVSLQGYEAHRDVASNLTWHPNHNKERTTCRQ